MIQGGYPPQLEFLGEFFFWFRKFNNFLKCNFKAFRSRINHSKMLKTHQGANIFFYPPHINFWQKPCPFKGFVFFPLLEETSLNV
jgi:hypothetical protein